MAVTDLSGMSDLPWWARQGGPMGTPSAAPAGAGAGGGPQAPAGVDPMQWLAYLQNMFVSPAAAEANPHGDEPPDQPLQLPSSAQNQQRMMASMQRPGYFGDTSAVPGPPGPPQTPPGGPGAGLSAPNYTNPMLAAGVGPGAGLNAGTPPPAAAAQTAAQGPPGYVGNTSAIPAAAPVSGPMANQRFIGIDRPNAPAGGIEARGSTQGPQGTALNLAGLFNRGPPQGAPAAIPGPLATTARPDLAQRVPLASAPTPPIPPPDIVAARKRGDTSTARAKILQPRYYT